jgi:hypothetical protein
MPINQKETNLFIYIYNEALTAQLHSSCELACLLLPDTEALWKRIFHHFEYIPHKIYD